MHQPVRTSWNGTVPGINAADIREKIHVQQTGRLRPISPRYGIVTVSDEPYNFTLPSHRSQTGNAAAIMNTVLIAPPGSGFLKIQ